MATLSKNPTEWVNNRVQGALGISTGEAITTQSGLTLTTQDGLTSLTLNGNTVVLPADTSWSATTKSNTSWSRNNVPYTVTVGTNNLVDNSGNFLVDNSGNFLVTTSTYKTGPNPTSWTVATAV